MPPVSLTTVLNLDLRFSKTFEKMINEKNLKQEFSGHCLFNPPKGWIIVLPLMVPTGFQENFIFSKIKIKHYNCMWLAHQLGVLTN